MTVCTDVEILEIGKFLIFFQFFVNGLLSERNGQCHYDYDILYRCIIDQIKV